MRVTVCCPLSPFPDRKAYNRIFIIYGGFPVPRITPRSWPRTGDAKTLGKGTRRSGRIIFRALLLSSPVPFRASVCGVIPEDGRPATYSAGRL